MRPLLTRLSMLALVWVLVSCSEPKSGTAVPDSDSADSTSQEVSSDVTADGQEDVTSTDATDATDATTQPDGDVIADADAEPPPPVECNDGIDNDGDGFIDWQFDLGCVNATDDEASGTRAQEQGFSTFDVGADSVVIYVANNGDDQNDGLSPEQPVVTLTQAASLVRDGHNDFILLRRGDTWRGEHLGRFKSGQDAAHPMVITSYGESETLPRLEVSGNFIDHNGQARSFVSIVGLELVVAPKVQGDSSYDGATGGGFRYVGGGTDLLIEGCRLTHCELVVQSYDVNTYQRVEVRRNVIELNYHVDTCGQNNTFRPSGMYASHVIGLTIEGNVFDHNGWNEDVPTACATMYNHNMYLNADDLVVRDNIIARASSMGIKMRSDVTGEADTLLFENNLFVDGEIGLGIGGNTSDPYRFSNVTIKNNVFSQIGLNNPTDRNFSWMLDMADIQTALVEGNYFLNQPWNTNGYGISLGSSTESDITLRQNLFYNLQGRSLRVDAVAGWSNVLVDANTFVDPGLGACLVEHTGGFAAVTYQGNTYSGVAGHNWFCGDTAGGLTEWEQASGETGASVSVPAYQEPERTVGSYAATLGLDASLESFLAQARLRTRLSWSPAYTAPAVNDYLRGGF